MSSCSQGTGRVLTGVRIFVSTRVCVIWPCAGTLYFAPGFFHLAETPNVFYICIYEHEHTHTGILIPYNNCAAIPRMDRA